MVGPLGGLEKKIVNPFFTCKPKMDQKDPVLGPLLAHSDPLEVRSDLENGRFLSQISESPDPPFFRKKLAQTFFGWGALDPPPIFLKMYHGTFSQLGGMPWSPPIQNFCLSRFFSELEYYPLKKVKRCKGVKGGNMSQKR